MGNYEQNALPKWSFLRPQINSDIALFYIFM